MRILKGAPLAFTSGAWTSCATELQMPLTALRNVDDWTWCRWTWHAKMCMKGTPKTDNTIDLGDPPNKNKYGTVTLQLLVKTSSWSAEVHFGKYPRDVVKGIKVAVQPFFRYTSDNVAKGLQHILDNYGVEHEQTQGGVSATPPM